MKTTFLACALSARRIETELRSRTHLVVHRLDVVHADLRERISERLEAVHGGRERRRLGQGSVDVDVDVSDSDVGGAALGASGDRDVRWAVM